MHSDPEILKVYNGKSRSYTENPNAGDDQNWTNGHLKYFHNARM